MPPVAVVLARLDSARFPGKALIPLGGIPLIEWVYRRVRRALPLSPVVLATTGREIDNPLASAFASLGGAVYRGLPDETLNVAKRFVSAAASFDSTYALRINGDSPFASAELIEASLPLLDVGADLVTNILPRSYPYGISLEAVRLEALAAHVPLLSPDEAEHVTAVFYRHPDKFRIQSLPPCSWEECPCRLTVDEPADLQRMERIVSQIGGDPSLATLPELIAAAKASHQ